MQQYFISILAAPYYGKKPGVGGLFAALFGGFWSSAGGRLRGREGIRGDGGGWEMAYDGGRRSEASKRKSKQTGEGMRVLFLRPRVHVSVRSSGSREVFLFFGVVHLFFFAQCVKLCPFTWVRLVFSLETPAGSCSAWSMESTMVWTIVIPDGFCFVVLLFNVFVALDGYVPPENKSKSSNNDNFTTLFAETGSGKYVPRAIMVDLEV